MILKYVAAGATIAVGLTVLASDLGAGVVRADPLLPCPQVARCGPDSGRQPLGTPDSPEVVRPFSGGQPQGTPDSPEVVRPPLGQTTPIAPKSSAPLSGG